MPNNFSFDFQRSNNAGYQSQPLRDMSINIVLTFEKNWFTEKKVTDWPMPIIIPNVAVARSKVKQY